MRNLLFIFLFSSFVCRAQQVKTAGFDKYIKQYHIELQPLRIINKGDDKTSIALSSFATNLYLELSGTGWGTTTIDQDNEAIFLFSNDSTIAVKSTGLQGLEAAAFPKAYKHQYGIGIKEVEALSRYKLTGIRKYSFESFSDIAVPDESADKVKKMSSLFIAELKKANIDVKVSDEVKKGVSLSNLHLIRQNEIRQHIGDSVTFCSKINGTYYNNGALAEKGTVLMLADASASLVKVLIREGARQQFPTGVETVYDKKEVCIYGVVQLSADTPQIIIHHKNQIRVTSLIPAEEAGSFIGDSVSIIGKIVSGIYLPDTKTQPTLLNMGEPFPDQLLTIVVQKQDRDQFTIAPETLYQNKTVIVSGKITLYRNKPQIVTNKDRIQVQEQKISSEPVVITITKTPVSAIDVQLPVHREKVNLVSFYTETFAAFPGSAQEAISYFTNNLVCPETGKVSKPKTVIVSFIVDMDGSINNIEIVQSAGKRYDEEVVKALQKMPRWKPRIRNGYMVQDKLYQTITFNCTAEKNKTVFLSHGVPQNDID